MSEHAAHLSRGVRLRRVLGSMQLRAVLTLGIVLGIGATATGALWTQSVSVPGTTFTAGTLDLQINDRVDDAYPFTTLALANMLPGDSYSAVLTVQNKSQFAAMRVTMDGRASGTLGSALSVSLYWDGSATNSGFSGTCSGTAVASATTLSGTDQTLITSVLTDARPAITAGSAQTVCVRIELPAAAASSLAGQSTQAVFTVRATSVSS